MDFNPALIPCLKAECDELRDGWCIQIRNVWKRYYENIVSKFVFYEKHIIFIRTGRPQEGLG